MSFVGTLVTACVDPSRLPSPLRSLDDLADVGMDNAAAVHTFSRNGWINNRLEELARSGHIALLPTSQALAVVFDSGRLGRFVADVKTFLARLPNEPQLLPESAREQADEAELLRSMALAPRSLAAALSALGDASLRDEEAESLETLVCLLWCQLRLAEHALANGLHLVCVRSA